MLRKALALPAVLALLSFGSPAYAVWTWSFTDMGVDYNLTFDSLSGNTGHFTLTVDTTGYDKHADPSYLDSVDIKAWNGTDISFTLLSAPAGTAWTPSEGSISSGQVAGTGCGGTESGFACVEAINKGALNVDNGPYTFEFSVTTDGGFNMALTGSHVGAGYADGTGAGASYGITSVSAPIPEPETYAMLLAGIGLMGFVARRRRMAMA